MSRFTFIDLFAGIGGLRLAAESGGGKCVFTSEWDKFANQTYLANYAGSDIEGDIQEVDERDIPSHDLLLAGFPCQPFSLAGVSKKNSLGRAHGFMDQTQGTLFFDVVRIIKHHQPKIFLLENVKNLLSHDKGHTFSVIKACLKDELGYSFSAKVIDAAHFLPQHRERIVMVGFRNGLEFDFSELRFPQKNQTKLSQILHPQNGTEQAELPYTLGTKAEVNPKYTISDRLWEYLQAYAKKHRERGNGFGFGLVTGDSVARTLSARYHKDGSEILVAQKGKNPRRLTPRECARLMGFADTFQIPVSDTQAYRQFGNSVAVPVFEKVVQSLLKGL